MVLWFCEGQGTFLRLQDAEPSPVLPYRYAKTMKDAQGWDNVKLEYLSAQFGIEQPDAHRAWCDAEANVGVFFKLKEMGVNSNGL